MMQHLQLLQRLELIQSAAHAATHNLHAHCLCDREQGKLWQRHFRLQPFDVVIVAQPTSKAENAYEWRVVCCKQSPFHSKHVYAVPLRSALTASADDCCDHVIAHDIPVGKKPKEFRLPMTSVVGLLDPRHIVVKTQQHVLASFPKIMHAYSRCCSRLARRCSSLLWKLPAAAFRDYFDGNPWLQLKPFHRHKIITWNNDEWFRRCGRPSDMYTSATQAAAISACGCKDAVVSDADIADNKPCCHVQYLQPPSVPLPPNKRRRVQ